MDAVIYRHTHGALEGISAGDAENCTIAYEPVWAIGTGKTATPQQANDAHKYIRSILEQLYGDGVAKKVRIQYGGSMNDANAKDLLSQSDIDGGLIGGAALVPEKFAGIVQPK
jgi:triosephosphate isomerase